MAIGPVRRFAGVQRIGEVQGSVLVITVKSLQHKPGCRFSTAPHWCYFLRSAYKMRQVQISL